MFLDRKHRVISCHDTWISIDPIVGCPFSCQYCVLRHSNGTGLRPKVICSPQECVEQLLKYPLFARNVSRLAIGNETDMFHALNFEYLVELLLALQETDLKNQIALITKARLDAAGLNRIRAIRGLRILFCLSYSGLGRTVEPNFTDDWFRSNFAIVRDFGFPILHFWRPLLPENSTPEAIERMLSFVSQFADASVFVGLKLHPELTNIIAQEGKIPVPEGRREDIGEWLEPDAIRQIYAIAGQICPDYPLYRHTSCGLAKIMGCPNHTGTVYRDDICPPSHCPKIQRSVCEVGRRTPAQSQIEEAIARLERMPTYFCTEDNIVFTSPLSQEEYAYLVQALAFPVTGKSVELQNLYYGNINEGRWTPRRRM
jgi:DNA repair photolyase